MLKILTPEAVRGGRGEAFFVPRRWKAPDRSAAGTAGAGSVKEGRANTLQQ